LFAHGVENDVALGATGENVAAVRADAHRSDLVVDRLQARLVRFVHEIYHAYRVVVLNQVHIWS